VSSDLSDASSGFIVLVFGMRIFMLSGCDDERPPATPSISSSTSSSVRVEKIDAPDMYFYVIHDEGRKITCYGMIRSSAGVGLSCLPDAVLPATVSSASGGPR
jgi:hypothetical protein